MPLREAVLDDAAEDGGVVPDAQLDLHRRRSSAIRRASSIWPTVTLQRPMRVDQAVALQRRQRAHAGRQRRARIGRVQLIEVDALDAERAPAGLARGRRGVARGRRRPSARPAASGRLWSRRRMRDRSPVQVASACAISRSLWPARSRPGSRRRRYRASVMPASSAAWRTAMAPRVVAIALGRQAHAAHPDAPQTDRLMGHVGLHRTVARLAGRPARADEQPIALPRCEATSSQPEDRSSRNSEPAAVHARGSCAVCDWSTSRAVNDGFIRPSPGVAAAHDPMTDFVGHDTAESKSEDPVPGKIRELGDRPVHVRAVHHERGHRFNDTSMRFPACPSSSKRRWPNSGWEQTCRLAAPGAGAEIARRTIAVTPSPSTNGTGGDVHVRCRPTVAQIAPASASATSSAGRVTPASSDQIHTELGRRRRCCVNSRPRR